MYRVDIRPRRKNSTKIADARRVEPFAKWVRGRPCHLQSKGGCGFMPDREKIEFAHVDDAGGKGMGLKVEDKKGIPLCPRHHAEQHGQIGSFKSRGGWQTFQLKYDFDATKAAEAYWNAWPGRRAWEAAHA